MGELTKPKFKIKFHKFREDTMLGIHLARVYWGKDKIERYLHINLLKFSIAIGFIWD